MSTEAEIKALSAAAKADDAASIAASKTAEDAAAAATAAAEKAQASQKALDDAIKAYEPPVDPPIDPPIEPPVKPPIDWWKLYATRSRSSNSRKHLVGISYWGANDGEIKANGRKHDAEVGLVDCWVGQCVEDKSNTNPNGHMTTMERITGGPYDKVNNTIVPHSQLNWKNSNSHWVSGWRNPLFPKGSLGGWVCNFISKDRATSTKANVEGDGSIWIEIKNGKWDVAFQSMGWRIWTNILDPASNPVGRKLDEMVIRAHHEDNQSNYYQVFQNTIGNRKAAMERIIKMVRKGIDDHGGKGTDLKFFHAPANGTNSPGGLGPYLSYCADNMDGLSVSWHPNKTQDTRQKMLDYCYDTAGKNYSLEMMRLASVETGLPMALFEWSPSYHNACPIADVAMEVMDKWQRDNSGMFFASFVYNVRTLQEGAYEGNDAAGKAAWARSCQVYRDRWSGIKP
jgi:hypothetical protein